MDWTRTQNTQNTDDVTPWLSQSEGKIPYRTSPGRQIKVILSSVHPGIKITNCVLSYAQTQSTTDLFLQAT